MSAHFKIGRCCRALVVSGLLLPSLTASADLVVTPTASTRLGVNDNRRLRDPDGPDLIESTTELALANELRRPDYSVLVEPRLRLTRHTDEEVLDNEDYFVVVGGERVFERQQLNLDFNFESEGTATTELTDSGIFDVNVKRTTLGIGSEWAYQLSDVVALNLFGGYTDVSYEDRQQGVFFDYDEANVGTGIRYVYSPTTTWLGNVTMSRFRTPDAGAETKSYALRFGFEHRFSETLDASVMAGSNISRISVRQPVTQIISLVPPRSVTRVVNEKDTNAGELVNLLVTKRFEDAVVFISWDRYFSPSSQGGRQRREEARGRGRYHLDEHWSVDGEIAYREYSQEGDIGTRVRALDFLTGTARANYHFARSWTAELAYRYRSQSEDTTDYDALSNEVFVGLRYEGDPLNYDF